MHGCVRVRVSEQKDVRLLVDCVCERECHSKRPSATLWPSDRLSVYDLCLCICAQIFTNVVSVCIVPLKHECMGCDSFCVQSGDRFWKMPECSIRGNAIKYICVRDELIDQVKETMNARLSLPLS